MGVVAHQLKAQGLPHYKGLAFSRNTRFQAAIWPCFFFILKAPVHSSGTQLMPKKCSLPSEGCQGLGVGIFPEAQGVPL